MEDKNQPNPDWKTPWYLRVRRSEYTKRQWRRLRPKMVAAARSAGVNSAYLFATHEVAFFGRDEGAESPPLTNRFTVAADGRFVPVLPFLFCGTCKGLGHIDTGGVTPWGAPCYDKCPDCE